MDAPESSPAQPRPAATVILLRRGSSHSDRGLELLMLKRGAAARFMPGVWVFAGGVVDHEDRALDSPPEVDPDEWAHRVCGARELAEEASVTVEPITLMPWSRWITPEQVPLRFDTRFYVASAPAHAQPKPELAEMDAVVWITPSAALAAGRDGEMEISFPTLRHLEQLGGFDDPDSVLAAASELKVKALFPKVRTTGERVEVLLPGDTGYDEA